MRWYVVAGLAVLVAGCPDREISELEPDPEKVEVKDVPPKRGLDLLFLVDKSPTMRDEQAALAASFPRFVDVLESIQGGLPDLHLGVITQDIGAGGYTVGGTCVGAGDGGVLQNAPKVTGCAPPGGQFISDITDATGGRVRNYTGTLAETFACIAQVGEDGCGFEQHLAAVELALGGSVALNAGFLRDDAYLGLVIISDEDDCSASNPGALFDPNSGNGPLGPVSDFRCAEYGWTCDGGPVARAPGSYAECEPRADSPYLHHPDRYVDFLTALKQDPSLVIVANIVGAPDPINVGPSPTTGNMEVKPSCASGGQNAEPMPRLTYFAGAFANTAQISICDPDLAAGLDVIAALLARVVGTPCFQERIRQDDVSPDPGLQLECEVSEVVFPGTAQESSTRIPRCAMLDDTTVAPGSPEPCYFIRLDTVDCDTYPTMLELAIHPPERIPPPGSTIHAECVTE